MARWGVPGWLGLGAAGVLAVVFAPLVVRFGEGVASAGPEYIETGDLPALVERGRLRVLMPPPIPRTLPRGGYSVDQDLGLAEELAGSLGLSLQRVVIRDRREMLEALLEGRGDLVVARLTATPERRERFRFSIALDRVREMLVVRSGDDRIRSPADLDGMRVAVRPSSSFHETLLELQRRVPGIVIVPAGEEVDTEEILYRLDRGGDFDATVADEDLIAEVRSYLDVEAAFPLTSERPIAWAMRPDAHELKAAVDAFLHRTALAPETDEPRLGDLASIRERRVLRVLTRNNAATYFLHRGRQVGFEFELASAFARSIGCRIQVVVPDRAEDLIPWLIEGRGDLIAASMTITDARSRRVEFSRPYNHVRETVVVQRGGPGEPAEPPTRPEDLAGRTITVRRSSAYHDTLVELQAKYGFSIQQAPEEMETEELISLVADGAIELTVADSNILDIERSYRDDIDAAFALGEPRPIAWAVRPEDRDLIAEIDRFLEREYRGTFFNVLRNKYFMNKPRVARVVQARAARQRRLSPYDELFRKWGREVEIDWRLLVAQAYQESRFDPGAESWAGAIGIMQVLPLTALELGVTGDLTDPDVGIEAGARYMRWLLDQFDPTLDFGERLRFSLAAYNAGRGHILDGRRLAWELGLDPDAWYDNVEIAVPLLAKAAWASKARYGYCRCTEARAYVRQINDRYIAYTRVLD